MAIYYFCPDIILQSAGIRILYRHVEILVRHGMPASMLHMQTGFRMPDVPPIPTKYLDAPGFFAPGDIVVMPEGFMQLWERFKGMPIRRFGMALNWDYIFTHPLRNADWRAQGVEHVISHSSFIGDLVSWTMRLPVSVFPWGIKSSLYFPAPQKQPRIVCIGRKQERFDALRNILTIRDPRLGTNFEWIALHGLSETDYAAEIRRAFVFINLSAAEGLPCSLLEAMRCQTLVAGYNSIGGQRELIGNGPDQNAILAETMDYATLAMKLEPVLLDALKGDFRRAAPIVLNGYQMSLRYDWNAEEVAVVTMWKKILGLP